MRMQLLFYHFLFSSTTFLNSLVKLKNLQLVYAVGAQDDQMPQQRHFRVCIIVYWLLSNKAITTELWDKANLNEQKFETLFDVITSPNVQKQG